MTLDEIRALAASALEQSEKATIGPWLDAGHGDVNARIAGILTGVCSDMRDRDIALVLAARTTLPTLAKSLIALLPYVGHACVCVRWRLDKDIAEKYGQKCDCGLDAALSGIEAP